MKRKLISAALAFILALTLTGCAQDSVESPASDRASETVEATRTSKGAKQPKTPETPDIYRAQGPFAPGELTYDNEWQRWELGYGGFPRIDGSNILADFIERCAQALLNPDGVLQDKLTDISNKGYAMDSFVWQSLRSYEAWYDKENRVSFGHSAPNLLLLAEYTPDNKSYLESDGGGEVTSVDFAKDALVFIVPSDFPIDDLTRDELRGILTGEITEWDDLGVPDTPVRLTYDFGYAGELAGCINRRVLDGEWLIEGEYYEQSIPNGVEPGGPGYTIDVPAKFEGLQGDIAIRLYNHAESMEDVKILTIDGVTPGAETIGSGEYQPVVLYSAVYHVSDEDGAPGHVAAWLLTDEGRSIIEASGLVPVS